LKNFKIKPDEIKNDPNVYGCNNKNKCPVGKKNSLGHCLHPKYCNHKIVFKIKKFKESNLNEFTAS